MRNGDSVIVVIRRILCYSKGAAFGRHKGTALQMQVVSLLSGYASGKASFCIGLLKKKALPSHKRKEGYS